MSSTGAPIVGASVSWTAYHPADHEWEASWQDDDWGPLQRPITSTVTDADGRFSFTDPPKEAAIHGSVLWATSIGHLAAAQVIPASESMPRSIEWTLEDEQPLVVRVIDAEGDAVPGARVDQFGLVAASVKRADIVGRARRLLARSSTTDVRGNAVLGLFPGEQVVVASLGASQSAPRQVRRGSNPVLTLVSTFTVEGTATFDSWEHLNYIGERRIVIEAQRGGLSESLASLREIEAGRWGPVAVPLVPKVERYRVRLEGSPVIPVDELFEPPSSDARLHFDLYGQLGHGVGFAAQNEGGEWLYDAEAKVWWQDKEPPFAWHTVERRARPEDAMIPVYSVPAGGIQFEVSASGYAPVRDVAEAPIRDGSSIGVVLARAGGIRGRCLFEGRPVEDFEVAVWPASYPPFRKLYTFLDREDGTFEIDDAPQGDARITASTAELPFVEPVALTVEAGEFAEVAIELHAPLTGVGQVIDAETGAPVTEAKVQLFFGAPNAAVPWGRSHAVDSDGAFEIAGFTPGFNRITITSPAHAALETSVRCDAAEPFEDLGTFSLFKPQPLEFRLVGDPPAPLFDFQLQVEGPVHVPSTSFPANGVLRIDRFSPGYSSFLLTYPDNTQAYFSAELTAGAKWVIERPVAGPRELEVVPVAEDDDMIARIAKVRIAFRTPQGYWVQCARDHTPGSPVRFSGIDGDSVQVLLLNTMQDEQLGSGHAAFGNQTSLVLEVPCGDAPFHVTVVGDDGEGVPNVAVTVFVVDDPSAAFQGVTDIEGRVELRGVPAKPIEVSLGHGTFGHRHRIAADGTVREHELLLSGDATIELALLDHAQPVESIACVFIASHQVPTASPQSSGPDGRVSLRGLTAGPYRIRCSHPDYWTVEQEVDAKVGAPTVPLQIRRLGALTLQAVAASGLPIQSVAITLRSVEFDADVGTWVAEGRVTGPANLLTDLRGEVRLTGLPHGPYAWRATLPDGVSLEGVLAVQPAQTTRFPIGFP